MSEQKFEPHVREAIWLEYNKRCFHCSSYIDRSSLVEVDHLIYEKISSKDLVTEREKYGLPEAFDLNGYENLVPACRTCNGRKSSNLPKARAGNLMWMLTETAKKAPNVLKRVRTLEKTISESKLLTSLRLSLKKGTLSMDSIDSVVEIIRTESNPNFTTIASASAHSILIQENQNVQNLDATQPECTPKTDPIGKHRTFHKRHRRPPRR